MEGSDPGELGPLPAGRHGYSREQIARNQRERLIAALAEAVAERGYAAVTIADITGTAQVSRRTFYEHFEGKEGCFLAAFDSVEERLHEVVAEATAGIPDWPHQVVAGLRALLAFFAAEPTLARICVVDAMTAGPAASQRYREMVIGFVPRLRPGHGERGERQRLPESTDDTVIGSIASLISREVRAGKTAELGGLLEDLATFALTPYLGPEAAHRIAAEANGAPA